MADPVTIMTIGAAATKAASGFIGGMSQASQYGAEADMDRDKAATASAQADAAEEATRRKGRQQLGADIAGIAQSGIGFTQTTQDTVDQDAANVSLDALNQRFSGAVQRTQDLNDASMADAKAKTSKVQSWLGLGSNLLTMGADNWDDITKVVSRPPAPDYRMQP